METVLTAPREAAGTKTDERAGKYLAFLLGREEFAILSAPLPVGFREQIAQLIEAALPRRPPVPNPLLDHRKSRSFDAASSHASDLLGMHQSALFEHLQVLGDRR